MISNILKSAFRQLMRHKSYSFINIMGLAVGIACCLMMLLYVADETGYDSFHPDGDRIYRMALDRHYPDRSTSYAMIPSGYSQAVEDELPQVEKTTRVFYFPGANPTLQVDENTFEVQHYMWADSTFFDMFGIKLLNGDPDRVLRDPNGAVLTETAAKVLFGDKDPIGEPLPIIGNPNQLVVQGVCEDVPKHSHFQFELLGTATSLPFAQEPNFTSFSAYTYLLLTPGADPADVEAQLPGIVEKYAAGPVQREFGLNYDEYRTAGHGYDYFLQPLQDIYLNSHLEGEIKAPGSLRRVYIFTLIAGFILLIAIINFMNLATAKSTERAKEVGIRKTLGGLRGQLMAQFLTEAVLTTLLSTGIALLILHWILPFFNQLSGKAFAIGGLFRWDYMAGLSIFSLLVGLLAGSYPAVVLSRFQPVNVLKGKLSGTKHGARLRNGLVVYQFAISVVLIISTLVVFRQMEYMRNKELGFNKEQVLSIQQSFQLGEQSEAFKEEIRKLPRVEAVGSCSSMPGGRFFGTSFIVPGKRETVIGRGVFVDEGFLSCLQIDVAEGRGFSRDRDDSLSLVINRAAARELGMDDPVGKRLATNDDNYLNEGQETGQFEIIGLVEDFNYQSLHLPVSPLFFVLNRNANGANAAVSVRLSAGDDLDKTLASMEALWARFRPDQPFQFAFLNEQLDQLYQAELVTQRVFTLFALLAIFIACLGLFGLAAFITRQRTKEIGVRKVLGASVPQIVGLLSRDFLRLVMLALLLASPIAWYLMHRWLENFAYSAGLSWWIFLLAGVLALLIAWLTVSFQSIRAAMANPVEALQDE